VNCGTRGVPDTVAPSGPGGVRGPRCTEPEVPRFGSRDSRDCEFSLAQRCWRRLCAACGKFIFQILILRRARHQVAGRRMDLPVHFERAGAVHLHDGFALAHRVVAHPLGMLTKFPTFMVCIFDSSKVSPIPTRRAPFNTVTFSSWDASARESWSRRRSGAATQTAILPRSCRPQRAQRRIPL